MKDNYEEYYESLIWGTEYRLFYLLTFHKMAIITTGDGHFSGMENSVFVFYSPFLDLMWIAALPLS